MDIDTPPVPLDGAQLGEFGFRYPLPFRILALSAVTLAGFATNAHLLHRLGIDTATVLDIRLDQPGASASLPLTDANPNHIPPPTQAPYVHPSKVYPPLYSLAAAALAWTAAGWISFRALAGTDPDAAVRWRILPAAFLVAAAVALCWPGNTLCRRERFRFLRALRRIVNPSLGAAVPFCDIILADILTSSAKVLGDVWIAGCLVVEGRGVQLVADECKRVWGVPFMTSLPYVFRFRQCLSEVYTGSTPTPRRSLLNALKYATAFPVIVLSAMQTVIGDPFDPDDLGHEAGERWIDRTTLFNLWILAVLINSLYSFWWDVTNDWGLSLLTPSGWSATPAVSYAFIHPPAAAAASSRPQQAGAGSRRHESAHSLAGSFPRDHHQQQQHHRMRSSIANGGAALLTPPYSADDPLASHLSTQYPPPPSRPHSPLAKNHLGPTARAGPAPSGSGSGSASHPGHVPTSSQAAPATHRRSGGGHTRAFSTATAPNLSYPFLRPILLLPDPYLYYLGILLDLVLRLTWSLKLSSHLHSAQEVEAGVFVVELMEVVRRWMWVYFRIEWEAVRKGAGSEVVAGDEDRALPAVAAVAGAGSEKAELDARSRAQEAYELAAIRPQPSSSGAAAPVVDIPSRV